MPGTKNSIVLSEITKTLIALALREDIGTGDITSECSIDETALGKAMFIARENLLVCGQDAVREVFLQLDRRLEFTPLIEEGKSASSGDKIAGISGPLRSILSGERTALNFMQRLSGVATLTASIVERLSGLSVKLLDTRKTTPGFRALEKYAVRVGGGHNHRMGLFDAVLLKNNHIDAMGGDIAAAISKCKSKTTSGTWIQVEVRNELELQAAVAALPDAVLLDNMSLELLRKSVEYVRAASRDHPIFVEASGGVSEKNIREIAQTGVDAVSMGRLTHSAPAMDISLRYVRL